MPTSGAAQDECSSRHITLDHVTLHSLIPLRRLQLLFGRSLGDRATQLLQAFTVTGKADWMHAVVPRPP